MEFFIQGFIRYSLLITESLYFLVLKEGGSGQESPPFYFFLIV